MMGSEAVPPGPVQWVERRMTGEDTLSGKSVQFHLDSSVSETKLEGA